MPKAPRYCPEPGCMTLIIHTPRCPQHTRQPWPGQRTASSTTTGHRQWKVLAPKILQRDHHQCQIRYEGICISHATQVDHIIPVARRPDLRFTPSNCRAACRPCNQHKARKHDRNRS